MKRLVFGCVLLAVSAAVLLGCAQVAPGEVDQPTLLAPTAMSDLTGMSVQQALDALAPTGLPVVVTYPGYEAAWFEESVQAAGTTVPGHDETISVGTRELPSGEISGGLHEVVAQVPAIGAKLSEVTAITLTAGPHPNTTKRAWLTDGHVLAVKQAGASPCFDCHDPETCSECHHSY